MDEGEHGANDPGDITKALTPQTATFDASAHARQRRQPSRGFLKAQLTLAAWPHQSESLFFFGLMDADIQPDSLVACFKYLG